MKKFLSCCLAVMMVLAVSASAVTWGAAEGFHIYNGEDYASRSDTGVVFPTEMTDNGDNSATVTSGGYFEAPNSVNGGVFTNEKVGLVGLEVVVEFEEVPVANGDCWFTIAILEKPQMFMPGAYADNKGYAPLIRYGSPRLEANGMDAWKSLHTSDNEQIFALKAGDVFKCNVDYYGGQLVIKYTNGDKVYEVPAPATVDLDKVFPTAEAYVFVSGNRVGPDTQWKYKVTVNEGTAYTEEILANKEFDKIKGDFEAKIDTFISDIELVKEVALEAVEGKDYMSDSIMVENFDAMEAAAAEAVAAKAECQAATTQEEVDAAVAKAQAAYVAANTASEAIIADAEYLVDAEPSDEPAVDEPVVDDEPSDEPAVDEPKEEVKADDAAEEEAAEEGFPVWGWALVIVAVVAIVAIAFVATKKKKQ